MLSMIVRKGVRDFLASRTGKILPVLLIALLIAAASSTVYVYYIESNTATVQTPDLKLFAGSDSTASCTKYPCATITVAATFDYAAASFSLFNSATNTPQPASYYSNYTVIKNVGANAHTINSIKLSNFVGVAALGSIKVWYCTTQTEFNPYVTLVTPGNCPGSSIITSGSGAVQTISGGSQALAAGARGFIEIGPAWAGAASGTVTFNIAFEWV
jgi:hypothetical protein